MCVHDDSCTLPIGIVANSSSIFRIQMLNSVSLNVIFHTSLCIKDLCSTAHSPLFFCRQSYYAQASKDMLHTPLLFRIIPLFLMQLFLYFHTVSISLVEIAV